MENNKDFSLENLPKKKISILTHEPLEKLTKKICDKIGLNYEDKNLFVIKKISSFNNDNYYEINKNDLYSDKTVAMELILNNTELFVETLKENEQSKWNKYLEKFKPKVSVTFNNINPDIKQKELIIFTSRNEEMINVKKEIINVLNNPLEYNMNNIIMKEKDKNGKEIIDLNSKLDSYFTFNECKIYIEKGTPLKITEKELIILFCEFDYEKFNFYPYKFTMINQRLIIDENKTIKDLKDLIIEKNLENFPDIKTKLTDDKSNKILIRKISSNPTKIFYDTQIIKDIIKEDFDLSHNIRFCIQAIPNDLFDDENINNDINNSLEVSMRYFDFSTWKLTDPIEVVIKDNITYEKLCDIILKRYPHLEKKENIQIIKLTGGYKIYLDTMLKFKPYALIEYLDSGIDKYPLFIKNDGTMLVIKDKRIEAVDPSEEIKKYGFEPLNDKNDTKNEKSMDNCVNSGGKVQQMIEMFNKGEFDPANKVHTDSNYKKTTKRAKEKGVTIKIKMLETEEDHGESKKEINKNEKEGDRDENKSNDKNKDNSSEEKKDKKETDIEPELIDYEDVDLGGFEPLI